MLFLTAEGGILGPITYLFGILMDFIYNVLLKFGVGNVGLAIIIFTLATRIILYPFTYKQQISTKLMGVVQPELTAIQKKYEGKKDQTSMMMMQSETREVQEKYGVSMTGSCIQLLIQMPIIFALYRVIMNVPAYVQDIKNHFVNIVNEIGGVSAIPTIQNYANSLNNKNIKQVLTQVHNFGMDDPSKYDVEAQKNFIIDFLYKLNPNQMNELISKFPNANIDNVNKSVEYINNANSFLGLNLATAPNAYGLSFNPFNWYLMVPLLAFFAQYISTKIMMKAQPQTQTNQNDEISQMQQSMKTMNIMFPIMSAFFCYGFASGIGIYWIASSVFMLLSQIIVNLQLKNINLDDIIKNNIKKSNEKRKKKGLSVFNEEKELYNLKHAEERRKQEEEKRKVMVEKQDEVSKNSDDYYFKNEDPNSLSAKANMLLKYNEKNNK